MTLDRLADILIFIFAMAFLCFYIQESSKRVKRQREKDNIWLSNSVAFSRRVQKEVKEYEANVTNTIQVFDSVIQELKVNG